MLQLPCLTPDSSQEDVAACLELLAAMLRRDEIGFETTAFQLHTMLEQIGWSR